MFSTPQVNIYSEDVVRSADFYRGVGFEETFRIPREGAPIGPAPVLMTVEWS